MLRRGNKREKGVDPSSTHSPRTRATPSFSKEVQNVSTSSSSSREPPVLDSKVSSGVLKEDPLWAHSTPTNFPADMGGKMTRTVG